MAIGLGIDVGASVVKLATDDTTSPRLTHSFARITDFPELASRMGTRVPHVNLRGDGIVTHPIEDLFVEEVRQATARVTGSGQTDASVITIIAPDWWTERARNAVREALARAGVTGARLVSGAIAAVRGHQATSGSIPDTVAVLDLGAYSCSAAVVTDCRHDPILVGQPSVLHGRGGNDLDVRILHHILSGLRIQGHTYQPGDPEAVEAARELLAECRLAKETLSARPAVTMSPYMPGSVAPFRLVRAEHDDIARPAVREIVQMLRDALGAAERDVDAVLLVGGGAPIPIVVQQISVELGLPVLLDDEPSTLAARGAAIESAAVLATMNDRPRRGKVRPRPAHSGTRRSIPESPEGRRRGLRVGAAMAYVALALALSGQPSQSMARSPAVPGEVSPSNASQDVGTAGVVPDPSTRAPAPTFTPGSGFVEDYFAPTSTPTPVSGVATTSSKKKATKSSGSSSSSGSGGDGGSSPDDVEAAPEPGTPPNEEPPPVEEPPPNTEEPTGVDGS